MMIADVEAIFYFNDNRKLYEGYRPAHMIDGNSLTTGIHHYYNLLDDVRSGVKGTIKFIAPEYYPNSLWVGKEIDMYDGSKKIGVAEILKVLNQMLQKELC